LNICYIRRFTYDVSLI